MALVYADSTSDTERFVDFMARPGGAGNCVDRARFRAHAATVALAIDIRFGSCPRHIDKTVLRTLVRSRNECFTSVIVEDRKISFKGHRAGGCGFDTECASGAPHGAVALDP